MRNYSVLGMSQRLRKKWLSRAKKKLPLQKADAGANLVKKHGKKKNAR